jgi:hypothetical protein
MSTAPEFTDAQREIVKREVNRHAIAAYERGIAEGKRLAGPVAIANWIKEAAKSWTMAGGAAAVAAGVAGQLWPVVAELLAGRVDPQVLTLIGGLVMALRAHSIGRQP